MKSKTIRSCAKKLLLFLVFLTIYLTFCIVIIILSLYNGKQEQFSNIDSNEKILILTVLLLLIFSTIFTSLYFYSQKLGLAEEIQKFDSRSAKENAAYRKPGASFVI